MKKYLLLAVIISVLFTSCQSVLKLYAGATGNYKKPKYETESSIIETVRKISSQQDGIYVCKDFNSLKYFSDSIKGDVPEIFIFDSTLRNVYKSKNCHFQGAASLDSNNFKGSAWQIDSSVSITKIMKTLKLINGTNLETDKLHAYTHIIFYVWANYAPKLSKDFIKDMGLAKGLLEGNTYIGSINFDLQKSW